MINKKYVIVLLLILVLGLSGCKRPNLAVSSDEKGAEIVAVNARKDWFGASSGFVVAEGEKLYIEPALNKGEISIKIRGYDLGADATVEELTDAVSGEDADLEITISGSDLLVYELKPGNYSIYASVISKADGTIVMNIR